MSNRSNLRWWPFLLLVLIASGLLVFIWFLRDSSSRQTQVMATWATLLLASGITGLWFMYFSGIPWRRRIQGSSLFALLGLLFLAAFEFEGMSGDLAPQFRFRLAGDETVRADQSLAGIQLSDYPQFQGPDRSARLDGGSLTFDWDRSPAELIWKRPVGVAISGFSVAGRLAITQEQEGEEEKVVAYRVDNGEVVWKHSYPTRYESTIAGIGPRSNPTIDRDRVFTMGATGWLTALDLETGKLLWSHNVLEENQRPTPSWGKSCSPLVIGDAVVITIHRTALVAYSASDGGELWRSGQDGGNYASPTLLRLAGRDQILSFNSQGPAGYAAEDGRLLWSFSWPRGSEHIALPVRVSENRLLVSSGYGVGTSLLELEEDGTGLRVREVWHSIRLKSKFANFFVIGDYIYGLDDGIMVCLELATGRRVWKAGRYGHGQMILVGDTILLMAEDGRVVAVTPSPEGLQETASIQALDGHTWNPPALAGHLLLVRNSREAAAYKLPAR